MNTRRGYAYKLHSPAWCCQHRYLSPTRKHLNAVVECISHVQLMRSVHRDSARILELALVVTKGSNLADIDAVGSKLLDAVVS